MEIIQGTWGNDTLTGNSDDNRLSGFFGSDYLIGGSGNETLDGGGKFDDAPEAGRPPEYDTLDGGLGADVFDFDYATTSTNIGYRSYWGQGYATIRNLDAQDLIDVSGNPEDYTLEFEFVSGNASQWDTILTTQSGDWIAVIEDRAIPILNNLI